MVINKPYASRSTSGYEVPAATSLGLVRIPLPNALRGFASNNLYYDSRCVHVTIKTVGSQNTELMANGITQLIIYRDSATTIKCEVERKHPLCVLSQHPLVFTAQTKMVLVALLHSHLPCRLVISISTLYLPLLLISL